MYTFIVKQQSLHLIQSQNRLLNKKHHYLKRLGIECITTRTPKSSKTYAFVGSIASVYKDLVR